MRKPKPDPRIAPGKQSKTKVGVFERTVLLPLDRADCFHAVISALPAFTEVSVQRDHKQVGDRRFYVRWQRQETELNTAELAMQDARIQRATEQFPEMEFLPMDGSSNHYYCVHFKAGEEEAALYQTSLSECDCPDHTFRPGVRAVGCKHRHALRIHLCLPEEKRPPRRWTQDQFTTEAERDF